jgi:hypothetical protein
MLEAGLDPQQLGEAHALRGRSMTRVLGSFTFQSAESDPVVEAVISLTPGDSAKLVKIEVEAGASRLIERFRALLGTYAANPDGETYRDQRAVEERAGQAWKALDRALEAAGAAPIPEDRRGRSLDAPTAQVLMQVYETNPGFRARDRVLFALQSPKTGRPVKNRLATWLVEQFPRFENRRHRGQIACALLDLAGPVQADGLAALIGEAGLGASRALLLEVLGKTKAPSAPRVLAGQLGGPLKIGALRGLRHLGAKAVEHAVAVQELLHDSQPEARRLARQALQRMGIDVEPPPAPVHLVKGKARPPGTLVEWSVNLDLDDLADALGVVGSTVDTGLGAQEVAEVTAIVESLRPDQTRTFKFPVSRAGRDSEVWVEVFMDDVNAPDLYVYAEADLAKRLTAAWGKSRFADH